MDNIDPRAFRCSAFLSKLSYFEGNIVNTSTLKKKDARDPLFFYRWISSEASRLDLPELYTGICEYIEHFEVVDIDRVVNGKTVERGALRMLIMVVNYAGSKRVFVGFRGTRPTVDEDWIHSLSLGGNSDSIGVMGLRHEGYCSLGNLVDKVYLKSFVEKVGASQIVFCGHSLGGAVAKLVSLDYLLLLDRADRVYQKVLCIALCDPTCVDKTFAGNLNASIPESEKIIHSFFIGGDVVPMILSSTRTIVANEIKLAGAAAHAEIMRDISDTSNILPVSLTTIAYSFTDSIFPDYAHIGTIHLFSKKGFESFPASNSTKVQELFRLPAEERNLQVIRQCHAIVTVVNAVESVLANTPTISFDRGNVLAARLDYQLNCLPNYKSHEVQRHTVIESGKETHRVAIIIHGFNFSNEYIGSQAVSFEHGGTRTDYFKNISVRFYPNSNFSILKVEADVRSGAQATRWDSIQCVVCPYFQPIILRDVNVISDVDIWASASPADVLQTAFAHTMLKVTWHDAAQTPELAGYIQSVQGIRERLVAIENALLFENDETTEKNKKLVIGILAKESLAEEIGRHPMSQQEIDYVFDQVNSHIAGRVATIAQPPQVLHSENPINATTFATQTLSREISSVSTVLERLQNKDVPSLEDGFYEIMPMILLLTSQISQKGEAIVTEHINWLPQTANGWALAVGSVMVVAGAAALTAGLALPIMFTALTAIGIASAVGGAVGGTTGLAIGSMFIHNNKGSKENVKQVVLVAMAGDYRHRISTTLNVMRLPAEAESAEVNHATTEEEEFELIRKCKSEAGWLNLYFARQTVESKKHLKALVDAVMLIHELRWILRKLKVVGVMGNHGGGKSTMIYNAFKLGKEAVGNAASTKNVTPYLHLRDSNVLILDFPGQNEHAMAASLKLSLSLTMNAVIVMSELKTELSTFIVSIISELSVKRTAMVLCMNKVDVFSNLRRQGTGSVFRPQFSPDEGMMFVLRRFQNVRDQFELLQNPTCKLWLTRLDVPNVKETEVYKTLIKLNRDEELFKKAYNKSLAVSPLDLTVDPTYIELRNMARDVTIMGNLDVVEFVASSCYFPVGPDHSRYTTMLETI